jgi:hypothetical protein
MSEQVTITEKQYLDWIETSKEIAKEIHRLKQLQRNLDIKIQGYLVLKKELL